MENGKWKMENGNLRPSKILKDPKDLKIPKIPKFQPLNSKLQTTLNPKP